jgi:hypothetical protein
MRILQAFGAWRWIQQCWISFNHLHISLLAQPMALFAFHSMGKLLSLSLWPIRHMQKQCCGGQKLKLQLARVFFFRIALMMREASANCALKK